MNKSNELLSKIVTFRTYSKYLPHVGRRETLEEIINRNMSMHLEKFPKLSRDIIKAYKQVHDLKVMPSMRSMQFAGEAISKNNTRIFNCSFSPIDRPRAFAEGLYVLLCGVGFGYSVQKHHTNQLPKIRKPKEEGLYVIHDSIEGWAEAVNQLVNAYFHGAIRPLFDFTKIRPQGSRLVGLSAVAPGPEPLKRLLEGVEGILTLAIGRKLRPIEVHDIICIIADGVLAGGIRRAATISLFDRDDEEMLKCKHCEWWVKHPYRARANNSAMLPRWEVTKDEFRHVYEMCVKSNAGEPGFVWTSDTSMNMGGNPCMEISLNPNQMCNLSTTNLTGVKTEKDFHNRVYATALLGTLQASYTDFPYLSESWQRITEKEALLGCSFTGIADAKAGLKARDFQEAAKLAKEVNEKYAKKIGINPSARLCAIKPEGCRPWDSLVTTDKGVLTLQELFKDHKDGHDWCDIKNDYIALGNDNRITKTYHNGKSEVFEIKMTGGISVRSTKNHPWFSKNKREFIPTKDLEIGDFLDIKLGVYENKKQFKLKSINLFQYKMNGSQHKDITFPELMNEDLAWLLGYIWADGSITSKNRVKFFEQDDVIVSKIKFVMKDLFNLDTHFVRCENKDMYEGYVSSVELVAWLHKNKIEKYTTSSIEFIPKCVRSSRKEDIIAFIAGFADGDGCIRNDKRSNALDYLQLTLTQKHSLFTDHLQQVALSVGLVFGRSLNTKRTSYGEFPIDLMHLQGFTLEESAAILKRNMAKCIGTKKPLSNRSVVDTSKHTIGKIKEIINLGVQETYDVEVENVHWFYAGAIKSHNTASCVMGSSSGVHARFDDYYLRRVRMNKSDALTKYLQQTVPDLVEDDLFSESGVVVTIPQESPKDAILRHNETAVQFFERVLFFNRNWVAYGHNYGDNMHNVSATINYKKDEIEPLFEKLWEHRNLYTGVSLLPFDGGSYKQAPFESCTKDIYEDYCKKVVDIDLTNVIELEDNTKRLDQLACAGGSCEWTGE